MSKPFDILWVNGQILTCEPGEQLILNGGIAIKENKIAWIGEMASLNGSAHELAEHVYNVKGKCITPGLIDCHTHLIYGGNRANEFEMRLNGISYEEIARKGGGIQATVNATRQISEEALFNVSLSRAKTMTENGVTCLEIKSGYGLDVETELKMLRVAQKIENTLPLTISKTFLGAHSIPIEYRNNSDAYVDFVCNEMIPKIADEKLADAVDVFCEKIAFNLVQTEKIFKCAKQFNLGVKCHAEQLSNSGSVKLAANYQAWSVDHLEYVNEENIAAMAATETVATLLPGAYYFLREKQLPPIHLLRKYDIPIAIATDCNPGTSPILSLLTVMNMAAVLFSLTAQEIFMAVTHHAAKALNMHATHGSLKIGKIADFVVWQINHPIELIYYIGQTPIYQKVKNGVIVS